MIDVNTLVVGMTAAFLGGMFVTLKIDSHQIDKIMDIDDEFAHDLKNTYENRIRHLKSVIKAQRRKIDSLIAKENETKCVVESFITVPEEKDFHGYELLEFPMPYEMTPEEASNV